MKMKLFPEDETNHELFHKPHRFLKTCEVCGSIVCREKIPVTMN
jgi:hypothetical protein